MLKKMPLTKTEHVYEGIRREIFDGTLRPEQRLRLVEVAARYETSAMPVREALRMLHRDGLISMHNHRGAIVSGTSPESAYQYAEARGVIETAAAELAAPFHTSGSLAKLRKLNARMIQAAEAGRPDEFRDLNRDFHIAICMPCPNEVLKTTLEGLWDQIRRMSLKSLVGQDRARMVSATNEHKAIISAIADGDVAKVATSMMLHAKATATAWQRVIDAEKRAQDGLVN